MDKNMGLSNKLLYVAVLTFLISSLMWYTQISSEPDNRKPLLGFAYAPGDSYVSRNFSTNPAQPNQTVDVTLTVRNLHTDYIYAIEEHVPAGFEIVDDDNSSYSDSTQLKWIYYSNTTPAQNEDFTYVVRVPNTEGNYEFTGEYQFESTPSNSSDETIGATTLTVLPPDYPPSVSLNSPSNGHVSFADTITFECTATDSQQVDAISLYTNYFGSWSEMTTNTSGILSHTVSGLTDSEFIWNCYACDNASQCSWGTMNRTVQIVTELVSINESGYTQLNSNPVVDGADITIEMPVLRHYTIGTHTVSVLQPAQWTDMTNFRVVEGGTTTKTVTAANGNISWSADLTRSAVLRFDVPAPVTANITEFSNLTTYNISFRVLDSNHLTNLQMSIPVIDGYSNWKLYQYETGVWPDRTGTYGLIVLGGVASFSGFSTSNQSFKITAINTTSTTTGLDIWDTTDSNTIYPNNSVGFFGRYYDLATGDNLTSAQASCNITFFDGAYAMGYNSSLTVFTYSKTFNASGDYAYDVMCAGTGYDTLVFSDVATISPVPYCGDGTCNSNESCSSCSADCGACANPGGGGGGGGGSGGSRDNDQEKTFEFNHDVYAITTLSLYSGIQVDAVEIASVPEEPQKKAYKLFQLSTTNEFQRATIKFKVPKQWYVENNMNKLTTTLMRYNGNEWEMLLTQKDFEDYDNIYFVSSASKFSPFAIVADQNTYTAPPSANVPDTPTPPPKEETPLPPEPSDLNDSEVNISVNDTDNKTGTDGSKGFFEGIWAYLSIASGMFIVIFFIIFTINKRKHMEIEKASKELNTIAHSGDADTQAMHHQDSDGFDVSIKDEEKIEKEAEDLSKEVRQLDSRLENYVNECKSKGFSSEQVQKSLSEAGWHSEDIKEALKRVF